MEENSDRAFGDGGDALAEVENITISLTVQSSPRRPSSSSKISIFPRYRSCGDGGKEAIVGGLAILDDAGTISTKDLVKTVSWKCQRRGVLERKNPGYLGCGL
ncbi:hypothetical protein V6N13_032258 [Hibiscus sabdariffa]|uniref:Uncharacterized protein n=2 Tax=Hibiscus sabdariffa TaxID=183260 RepID=A0ABR2AIL7_9ROSI